MAIVPGLCRRHVDPIAVFALNGEAMLGRMWFKGAWRDYQARVLEEMDRHLADGRLHIVAAPGSGKTVLGLEAMRRIGRPAVILAPSLTIRDQWRERLFPMFLDDPSEWAACISTDLAAPATMTLATYQALHAIHAGRPERFDALVAALEAAGPITLIVDEAHHLRREWWTALLALRARLDGALLIALTATPPYDAPFAEWSRYEALCGPIDSEISVPELVRNGDLCPHQDHVHLSQPRHDEKALLLERRGAIEALGAGLFADTGLIDCLSSHPWLSAPEAHEEELLERPDYATAMMMALRAAGRRIPRATTDLLGVQDADLPAFTPVWLERLLDGLIHEPHSRTVLGDERWTALRRTLDRLGLIGNGRVTLRESRAMFAAAAGSVAKLDSIVEIARAEQDTLGKGLRLVILSDHVRANDLPDHPAHPFAPAKLGVAPIFEALRRAEVAADGLAILTGTLVVLPARATAALDEEAAALGLDLSHLRWRPLAGCPGHVAVSEAGGGGRGLVALVTQLFQRGRIRILVGTQALLGEGWDAPTINSLVLASNAGSYMLSNQMRGRAIRIDPAAPGKVAAIWHLATVHPGLADGRPAGDADLLARRFDTFEGIANDSSDRIENGMDRLALDLGGEPAAENAASLARARDRAGVAAKWQASVGGAAARSHVRRVAEVDYTPRALAWRDTLQALVVSALLGGAWSAVGAIGRFRGASTLTTLLLAFIGLTFLYSLPKLARAAMLLLRNGTLERSLVQTGRVLADSLRHAGALGAGTDHAIVVRRTIGGRHDVAIQGVTRAEERIFLDALAELLGPVQNPRYLLVRQSRLWRLHRADYHAVPAVLGARRDVAEHFHRQWQRSIGGSRLVYTRSAEGRRLLLRARIRSFAAGMQRFFQRRSVWM